MKTKIFFYMVLVAVIFPSISISQDRFSFGVKGGIGSWRYVSLQESPNIGHPLNYSHPIGFTLGFYTETKILEHFSMVNELLYQNSGAKGTIYTGPEGILDQEITTHHLIVPILFKYTASWLFDIYFSGGPCFVYLIKAKYNYYDHIYSFDRGNVEITNDLPRISTAIEFGFGKEVTISRSNISFELRTQLGLTKYYYRHIGEWYNSGFIFIVGYKIN
jgi:hypothetical protein